MKKKKKNREQEENEPLLWKNVTVLLGDPTIEGWYTYYIPQDDLDMVLFFLLILTIFFYKGRI